MSHLRARYYDPSVGTLASLDPFEGYEDRPMSMNGYSYAESNPINWTDPSGEGVVALLGLGAITAIGGLVGAGIGDVLALTLAEGFWYRIVDRNECGDCRRLQALQKGKQQFVKEFRDQGGFFGAIGGALTGLTLGASLVAGAGIVAGIGLIVFGVASVALGVSGAVQAIQDILKEGLNICNASELALSVVSAVGGYLSIKAGVRVAKSGAQSSQSTGNADKDGQQNPSGNNIADDIADDISDDGRPVTGMGGGADIGQDVFGHLEFKGLVQNRPLSNLTHHEITNAFKKTHIRLTNHAIMRLKHVRTKNLGMLSLNDFARHFNKGIVELGNQPNTMTIEYGKFRIVINPDTKVIVTISPN